MTHDELLDEICMYYSNGDMPGSDRLVSALRAIVGLHKPIHHEARKGFNEAWVECSHCNDGCWGCGEWGCSDCKCKCHQAGNLYPCPTILAIEKELG